jgi:GMP reductase
MEPQLDFKDVLIQPQRSSLTSRSQVFLERLFKFKNGELWEGIPIVAANMDTTGTFEVYDVLSKNNILTAMNKFYTVDDFLTKSSNVQKALHPDMFMVSTGISDADYDKLTLIMRSVKCKFICIDVANGYMESLLKFCQKVRKAFPSKVIVAGNVATKERVQELIIHGGVDIVKLGIGPGSVCTTRVKTGVGVPQLSSILECVDIAHNAGGYVMADGGITCPGDMGKAFGAGADFVMMGGQFAGHDENPGEVIEENGKKFKEFYGMSSQHAMNKHYGEMKKYRSSEGRHLKIPYKGPLQDTVNDFLGGLRSACSYVGVDNLSYLSNNVTFRIVGQQFNSTFTK